MGYYLLGLAGNAVLACCLRHGAMQRAMAHHDHLAPLRMVWLSIPAYMSPLNGMMRIGSMFEHGNSVGAAFVLLVLGIGMSLGTLAWLTVDFGWRRVAPWFAVYVALVLAIAYACEPLLWDHAKVEADHTHAFDDLSSPFSPARENTPATMRALGPAEARRAVRPVRAVGRHLPGDPVGGRRHAAGRRPPRPGRAVAGRPADARGDVSRGWDRRLSGVFVGGTAILGLVVFSVVGAYVYYPDRAFCLERMRAIAGDTRATLRDGRVDESIRYLEQWDLVARQLQVGCYLRDFGVTPEQAKTVDDLREAIEAVRDDLRANRVAEADRRFDRMIFTGEYKACRECYALPAPRAGRADHKA